MSQPDISLKTMYKGGEDIVLADASFTWPSEETTTSKEAASTPKNAFTLADLNLRFPASRLSLICGRLGERISQSF